MYLEKNGIQLKAHYQKFRTSNDKKLVFTSTCWYVICSGIIKRTTMAATKQEIEKVYGSENE